MEVVTFVTAAADSFLSFSVGVLADLPESAKAMLGEEEPTTQ
jgi:hypothetical protein